MTHFQGKWVLAPFSSETHRFASRKRAVVELDEPQQAFHDKALVDLTSRLAGS